MAQYLIDDRRCKPEGEHFTNLVKPRFNDAVFAELEAEAAMTTEGKLAPLVRELATEALIARRERRAQMMEDLAQGKALDDATRDALATLLAHSASRRLLDSVAQRKTA